MCKKMKKPNKKLEKKERLYVLFNLTFGMK